MKNEKKLEDVIQIIPIKGNISKIDIENTEMDQNKEGDFYLAILPNMDNYVLPVSNTIEELGKDIKLLSKIGPISIISEEQTLFKGRYGISSDIRTLNKSEIVQLKKYL